ncbi:hypothetical protein L914_02833 [Phytophthora nicotianae]|nr:hypothetical protein L914_02833 [Phytophthora nicotianae]
MASSTIVCGGGCVAAAERATSGGCPGCECPAGAFNKAIALPWLCDGRASSSPSLCDNGIG